MYRLLETFLGLVLVVRVILILILITVSLIHMLIRKCRCHLGMGSLLDLTAKLGHLLHLLNRRLMSLKRGLDHLRRTLLFLRDFLQRSCVLLLLLEQLLVHLGSLLRLAHKLINQLLALVNLVCDGRALIQRLVLVHGITSVMV